MSKYLPLAVLFIPAIALAVKEPAPANIVPKVVHSSTEPLDDGDLRATVLIWDGVDKATLLLSRISPEGSEVAAEIGHTRGSEEPVIKMFKPGVLGSSIAPMTPSGDDAAPIEGTMACSSAVVNVNLMWIVCVCWQEGSAPPTVCLNILVPLPS